MSPCYSDIELSLKGGIDLSAYCDTLCGTVSASDVPCAVEEVTNE